MYTTAEVRWFFPGRIPPEVHDWFVSAACLSEPPARRVDKYMILPGAASLGIKLRQGRLEIKLRKFDYGEVRLHDRVSGHMGRWRKWSLALDQEDDALAEIMNQGNGWLDVHKERYLSRFAVKRKNDVVPIEASGTANSGCEVELTSVEAFDHRWWTIALESFGEEYALGHNLARVSERIFSADTPPLLDISQSRSYPQWLQDNEPQKAEPQKAEPQEVGSNIALG
jgi:hypothetical protein